MCRQGSNLSGFTWNCFRCYEILRNSLVEEFLWIHTTLIPPPFIYILLLSFQVDFSQRVRVGSEGRLVGFENCMQTSTFLYLLYASSFGCSDLPPYLLLSIRPFRTSFECSLFSTQLSCYSHWICTRELIAYTVLKSQFHHIQGKIWIARKRYVQLAGFQHFHSHRDLIYLTYLRIHLLCWDVFRQ